MTTLDARARSYRIDEADRRRTQQAIDAYNDLLTGDFLDSTRQTLSVHAEHHSGVYGAAQFPRILRPCLLTASAYATVCRTAQAIATALRIAVDRLAADSQLRRTIGIPEYLEPIIAMDAARGDATIGRIDGFIDEDGWFKAIEYNADPAINGGFELNCAFAATPIARVFGQRHPFHWMRALDSAYGALVHAHHQTGRRGTPVVAAVGLKGGMGEQKDWRWIAYVAGRGLRVLCGAAEDFEYRDGRLTLEAVPIDQIVLTSWSDLLLAPRRTAPILSAFRDGAVTIVNGVTRSLLATYKSTFEMLSDPQYRDWFPADVAHALESCIPWTRVLRDRSVDLHGRTVDLLDYVSQHRDQFVLKPSGAGKGVGVLLGWTASADEWNRVLRRRGGNYVVQERVATRTDTFPVEDEHGLAWRDLVMDCCPFVWNGARVSGCLVRTAESGRLQNVAAGGVRTATWVLGGDGDDEHES